MRAALFAIAGAATFSLGMALLIGAVCAMVALVSYLIDTMGPDLGFIMFLVIYAAGVGAFIGLSATGHQRGVS